MVVDRFVVGRGEAQKKADPRSSRSSVVCACSVLCKLSKSMAASYAGKRQSKSITCIHREKIQLNEQTLPYQDKPVWEAGEQRHPLPTYTSPYPPPPRHHNTPIQKLALVQARPEDINIGLRRPVPNEQAADCTDSVEATGRTRRHHDANPRVHDILHNRNQ